jgi:two-component system, LuxR family, response regulator FixJ
VRGASAKEVGRSLSISPRTVEVHRANIMRNLVAKNTIDLVRNVLGE